MRRPPGKALRGRRWDVRNAGSFGTVSFDQTPSPSRPRQTATSKRSGALAPTLIILGVLAVVFMIFTTFYTDFLWYSSVDKSSVFTTLLATQLGLFVVFGLIMATAIGVTMLIAYRSRPEIGVMSAEQISLERYRASLEPFHKADPDRDPDDVRRDGRHVGLRAVAVLDDVPLRHPVRHERPAVQHRHQLLRPAVPVPALRARVHGGRADPVHPHGGGHALRLRRAAAAGRAAADLARGARAAVDPRWAVHAAQGRRLLAGPLRPGDQGRAARRRVHRPEVPRRQRGAAGQGHPGRDRTGVRRAVLRQRLPPGLDAAAGRDRPAGHLRAGHRRHLPGDRPAVPGQALGAGARAGVHQAQHRGHTCRLRPGQGEVRGLLR